jgi:hypothetical protein
MVSIHQLKQSFATLVTKNLPIGYYSPNVGAQTYEKVRMAQVNTTTDGDQQAAVVLNSYFMKVKRWTEKYKADRQSMDATKTMNQDFLSQDADWLTIQACESALNIMLADRSYNNIPLCQ